AAAGRAEGELSLTIEPADSPPPPPKPSLRLEDLAPIRVEVGQTKTVPVKIKRERCPGPVQVELAKASSSVTVRNGLVGNDSKEGTVEVVVAADAKPGERTLRLRAVAAAAKTEGDLPLIV